MTETPLIEPSIAEAMQAIVATATLPFGTRTHMLCSLRQICRALDKPPETVPARWSAIKIAVHRLHPSRVGSTAKTLANHKSNVRAALLWFADEKNVPKIGASLSPEWTSLRGKVREQHHRKRLSGLMRYCSAKAIGPEAVDESVLDDYMEYRARTTALATNPAARRAIARAWQAGANGIKDWPSHRLIEPPVQLLAEPEWNCFPDGLRDDIERYLAGFNKIRRGAKGKRIRPAKANTIATRRRELQAFARRAVQQGFPIESLTCIKKLLDPSLVEDVLNAYWKRNGDEPTIYTIDLAWKLLSVAREANCHSEDELKALDDIRAALDDHRRGGLTEKNLKVIRQVLTDGVWDEVVQLPTKLMAQAHRLQDQAPMKAAVTAQLAVAIAILIFAPIRMGNLIQIRLGENLIKPGGLKAPYWLVFPHYDVKNRVQLEFPLDAFLSELIDEYVHNFRPTLLRGAKEAWLFPGETGGVKTSRTLSLQITARIEKATGLRITAHQFRHAAAAILLKHRPGDYELVQRLLGHLNGQTTRNFYVGFETIQASGIFGEIVKARMNKNLDHFDDQLPT